MFASQLQVPRSCSLACSVDTPWHSMAEVAVAMVEEAVAMVGQGAMVAAVGGRAVMAAMADTAAMAAGVEATTVDSAMAGAGTMALHCTGATMMHGRIPVTCTFPNTPVLCSRRTLAQ